MPKLVAVLIAGAASCALFMVLHAMNWRRVLGDKWTRPPRTYVAGVAGMAVPFTALMALWGDWWAVWGAAAVAVGGGVAVLYGHYVRSVARRDEPPQPMSADEYEAIIRALRQQNAALEKKLMWMERKNAERRDAA